MSTVQICDSAFPWSCGTNEWFVEIFPYILSKLGQQVFVNIL